VTTFAFYALGISMSFFLCKYGLNSGFRQLEAVISKPHLVRETSRLSWKNCYEAPFWFLYGKIVSSEFRYKKIFQRMVLNKSLENTLQTLTAGYLSKKSHKGPLRNFLFYG
jgi:ATPase family AAA domain-containing protein 3A/B